jgi:hypothetical protein
MHPARSGFREIYKKTTRVAGGLHDMGLRIDYDMKAAMCRFIEVVSIIGRIDEALRIWYVAV